jgi:hypothetical protein
VKNIGNHAWWKVVVQKYFQYVDLDEEVLPSREYIRKVTYGGSYTETRYPYGTLLAGNMHRVIKSLISYGNLPVSDDAIYVLLPAKNVQVFMDSERTSQFCTRWIGWHGAVRVTAPNKTPTVDLKFAVVPNHYNCRMTWKVPSPNNNPAIDAEIDTMIHEIGETATDPYGSYSWTETNREDARVPAWYDDTGREMGDKCNDQWNKAIRDRKTGALYDLILAAKKFLVQDVYDPVLQQCQSFSK